MMQWFMLIYRIGSSICCLNYTPYTVYTTEAACTAAIPSVQASIGRDDVAMRCVNDYQVGTQPLSKEPSTVNQRITMSPHHGT